MKCLVNRSTFGLRRLIFGLTERLSALGQLLIKRNCFFAAMLSPVLDGFEWLLSLSTVHQLSSAAVIESQHPEPRIEPGPPGGRSLNTTAVLWQPPIKRNCLFRTGFYWNVHAHKECLKFLQTIRCNLSNGPVHYMIIERRRHKITNLSATSHKENVLSLINE